MSSSVDPTEPIRKKAASYPDVVEGTSCNQSSFKAGKAAFLYIGPGAKGVGYKAMFKLEYSMAQAQELATAEPTRFEVGSTGWVTVRFSAEEPLRKSIWEKWLRESYDISRGSSKTKKAVKKATQRASMKSGPAAKKKSARKAVQVKKRSK